MFKIGEIFYLDEKYSERAKFCNNNNLMIVELEPDENGRRFQIQTIPEPTQEDKNRTEYYNLLNWFDNQYTYKEQKYRRLMYINKADDDGVDASEKLALLYTEAEEKRARIQQLEVLLKEV